MPYKLRDAYLPVRTKRINKIEITNRNPNYMQIPLIVA